VKVGSALNQSLANQLRDLLTHDDEL